MFPKLSQAESSPPQIKLEFESIAIPQLIDLVYSQVLNKSYIIHSDVLARIENVTIRLNSGMSKQQARGVMRSLLDSYGIEVINKGTHLFIQNKGESIDTIDTFFYKPKYRKSSYLLSLISPVLDGFANKRKVENVQNQSTSDKGLNKLIDKGGDGLLFVGSSEQITLLKKLLAQTDTPQKQVKIQAFVYEVTTSSNESSALQIVSDIIGSTSISASVGAARAPGQYFQISTPDLSILFNMFNTDNRFEVLTSPSLLVRNGQNSRFSVGTETPIVSGLAFPGSGSTAVQGVEYRASGVIFQVTPTIHDNIIDVELSQEISTFVQTTTGVSSSPTLISRDIQTSFSLESGQLVVMAGLRENRDNHDSTYLPFTNWEIGKERSNTHTEVILLLHCELINKPTYKTTQEAFLPLDDFIQTLPDGKPFIPPIK